MIVTFILNIFYRFILTVISVLPTASALPSAVDTALTYVFSLMWYLNYLLPIDTLVTILLLALTFHLALALWSLGYRIIGIVRGFST
jgi:hypothetical protein